MKGITPITFGDIDMANAKPQPRKYYSMFRSGIFQDPSDDRDYLYEKLPDIIEDPEEKRILTASSLPPVVDYTEEMSPVKYQGNWGSCVAFAAAALKEWQEQKEHLAEVEAGKKYQRKEAHYNLSEQWIYWNCKKIDPWPDEEGTNIRSAMKVLQKIGVPTEEAWPYSDDPLKIGKPASWATLIARWATIGSYWRVRSLNELRNALVAAPVVIGIALFKEFYDMPAAPGYVPMPADPNDVWGYHAVTAVGYDDKRKMIKIKNSWSKFWGYRGYVDLPYEYIEKYMDDAWAARDIAVTADMLGGVRSLVE